MAQGTVIAKLNHLRMSPRKVRLVTNMLKGKPAIWAVACLENMVKDAAKPILKLLFSAMANAKHNFDMKDDRLKIKQIIVNGGPILHRWMPRAMGRATPIRKRSCHIELTLEGEMPEKKKKKESAIEN